MKRSVQWVLVIAVAALMLQGSGVAAALDKQTRLDVMSAVVQVSLVKVDRGQVYYLPWGSGTIVSADGLILTNCHVADPRRYGLSADQVPDYDYLGVSLTVRSDRPPQLTYLADVVQADATLDLAVIRIVKKMDLRPVAPEDLDLPYVEVGDSDLIEVGDDLNILGYPGIGGDTITFTRGVVSGFTQEANIDGRAWIKTDASISGGNSGGTCVDESGLLIGVPTRAGVGEDSPVDCRPVKDTNGDRQINDEDDCVPVGGFINALRPVNLAIPLIEAARMGLPDPGRDVPVEDPDEPAGVARMSNLFFSTGANEFNQPAAIVTSLPSGARSLFLFFDYEGMSSSLTAEMQVFIDGEERPDWSLPAGPWGGNEHGMWWIGWGDAGFEDGTYEMVLLVEGEELNRAAIAVGGAAREIPSFTNLLLSLDEAMGGGPSEPAVLFPAGTRQLLAFFEYDHLKDGTRWTHLWTKDGKVVAQKDDVWSGGASGRTSLALTSREGLLPGEYRLTLTINGKVAALTNFWVIGDPGGGASFGPISFAEGIDSGDQPVGVGDAFATGLEELYAFSSYSGMEDGLDFSVIWSIDGEAVLEDSYPWDGGESGDWHYFIYSSAGALPDGEYGIELAVEGQTLQQANTTVGGGRSQRPTPVTEEGVQGAGRITDVDTGRGIGGAMFLVLVPGITLEGFTWSDDEVYTSAEADRQGYFELPELLERGECYTMIIGAQGYWAYGEDGVCIDADSPDALDLSVQLEKK